MSEIPHSASLASDSQPSAYEMMVSVQDDLALALEKARRAYMDATHPSRVPALKLVGLIEDLKRTLEKELPDAKPPIGQRAPAYTPTTQREAMQEAAEPDPRFSAFPSATRN